MLKFPLLCIGLLLSCLSFSQENFLPGYIVASGRDTVQGFINREVNAKLSKGIQFKNNINQQAAVNYTPADIASFGFEGGNTFRRITYTDVHDENQVKTEFAISLLDGYYQLYAVPKNEGANYFIKDRNDSSYYIYDDYLTPASVSGAYDIKGNYKNILYFLGVGCEKKRYAAEQVSFNEHEILRYLKNLNECMDPGTSIVNYKKQKNVINTYVHAGGLILGKGESQLHTQVIVNIGMPEISRNVSLQTGISYLRRNYLYTIEKMHKNSAGLWVWGEVETPAYLSIVSLPFLMRYSLTTKRVQPYFYLGPSLAILNDSFDKEEQSGVKGLQKTFGLAMVGGAGIDIYATKRLSIKGDWRYELMFHHPTIGLMYKLF